MSHWGLHLNIEGTISDLDFADDIVLILDQIEEAQAAVMKVEAAAAKVGLHLNSEKTKAIIYNQEETQMKAKDGEVIENVKDFKYLGAWIDDSAKDVKTRKAQAWVACNKLSKIWKSTLKKRQI